jgi:hypothetical protein
VRTTRPSRVDANQAEIVHALQAMDCKGISVADTHEIGKGFPDIVVGYKGLSYMFEIKLPGEKLTPRERIFHNYWTGHIRVVYCVDDVLRTVGLK